MRDEEERADQSAVECEFAYTNLCSLRIQRRLEWEFVPRWLALQMGCNSVYLLCMIERLKWQESHENAADRGDRVESVYTRVYSISRRCSISVHFLGVQVFLLPVNHACKACETCTTNRSVAVDNNLDEPLETTMVVSSGLRVDGDGVRLVAVGREVEEPSAVVGRAEECLVEGRVAGSVGELLQRVVGGHHEPFGVGQML